MENEVSSCFSTRISKGESLWDEVKNLDDADNDFSGMCKNNVYSLLHLVSLYDILLIYWSHIYTYETIIL